jgi:nitric oxide reductase subunit B
MNFIFRNFIRFTLSLLFATLLFGLLSSWAFLYPESYNKLFPFYQLHALHVSSAIFWIITGAAACILYYKKEAFNDTSNDKTTRLFILSWAITILIIFVFYFFRKFGGREYWEFPPALSIPLLASWILFMIAYFLSWKKSANKKPLYSIMWSTGVLFFLITFLEQNAWQVPWFRESFLREITVQWKANGSMVGAWNQMIYGVFFFLMVKLSGDAGIAQSRKAYFFYFLGLVNLMFNWGHHIYNVPTASWIRTTAYIISMTEWLFLINIIQGFKAKMEERRRMRHIITYRFLIAAEMWVLANLGLAIMMSIPAINRYTHGTHITVAHAMGTTIGINTMILLGGIGYMLDIEQLTPKYKKLLSAAYYITQVSLAVFWLALIVAGLVKGYRNVALNMDNFREMMEPVISILKIFSLAGIGVFAGLSIIIFVYLKGVSKLIIQKQ